MALLVAGCASDPAERCELGDAPFTVVSSEVRGQFVRLGLEYAGGCQEHTFAVWWDGIAAPSNPPQVPLRLQHYDHGDRCEAQVSRSIWVDLSLLQEVHLGSDQLLIVVGGSQSSASFSVTFAAPATPPALDVLTLERSCDVPQG